MKTFAKIFFLTLFLFLGCNKDDDNNTEEQTTEETFEIFSEQTDAKIFELVIIKSLEVTFNTEEYNATLGESNIVLRRNNDGNLVFIIPDEGIGNKTLKLYVNGKKATLNFTISENEIASVQETLNTEFFNPMQEMQQTLLELNDGSLPPDIVARIASSQQLYNDVIEKYNQATEEEKMEMAKFYNANKFFTTPFEMVPKNGFQNETMGADQFLCILSTSIKFVVVAAAFAFAPQILGVSIFTPIGFAAFIGGAYLAVTTLEALLIKLREECYMPRDILLYFSGTNVSTNNNAIINLGLGHNSSYINTSDSNHPNTTISNAVEKISYVSDKWNEVTTSINEVISNVSGWFLSFLGSGNSYATFDTQIESIPTSTQTFQTSAENQYISITDVPSDIDYELNLQGVNGISLRFSAQDTSTLPRTFTVNVKYDDEDFEFETPLTVTLEEADENSRWYLIDNLELVSTLTDVCNYQEGKKFKYYVNLIENDDSYSATLYFREIDDIIGMSNTSLSYNNFEPLGNSEIAENSEETIGDMNSGFQNDCGCWVFQEFSRFFSVSLYYDPAYFNLRASFSLFMRGNSNPTCTAQVNDCTNCYATDESYGLLPVYGTYIGSEAPSDL